MNGCRSGCLFRQPRADGDYGKLCAARRLEHVEIPVAVTRIKRFHRYRNQEIALSGVANALALRGMADALDLMQGMRHMIRKSGLLQYPLVIRRTGRLRKA